MVKVSKTKSLLGIDIGGSGIKGALVNPQKGELTAERHRIATPQPATPAAVAETVLEIVAHFDYQGPVGCTFPAIVKNGHTLSAANVDDAWINCDADALLSQKTGHDVHLINDADAAGLAEMRFGSGKGLTGVVMMLTLGTGIGSALFIDGALVPNTELGHLYLANGNKAEPWAADVSRKSEDLGWETWAGRVEIYLKTLERLFSPNLFIIGGGVSKKSAKFFPYLTIDTEIVPAKLRNEAGIIGAALWAAEQESA